MTHLNLSIFAVPVLLASVVSASAEDLDGSASAQNWEGLYGGVQIGYSAGNTSSTAKGERIVQIIGALSISESDYDSNPDGVFGGIQAGYNVQVGSNLVLGIEAGINAGEIADVYADPAAPSPDDTISSQIDWQASVRGRAGVTVGDTLLFGTGGMAWGKASISMTAPLLPDESTTLTGWVVGAGTEHMVSEHTSLKLEYLYTSYQDHTWFPDDVDGRNYALEAAVETHNVNVGLNYHF
ncbi:outer membrane beta-barrel protein [Oricola sp.]|uniref:outer membrane protein n=1 Tax=Oricola sp. TaxID=1979950 RepID=UPI0025E1841D|nr:outer membrane beta-barrel protein [Oricola sp.]MCI5077191.1 outer membrane beta-barrel protein [Oricola sp.]